LIGEEQTFDDHKGEESAAISEETWLNYQNDLVTL